jgi:hypothetical protein
VLSSQGDHTLEPLAGNNDRQPAIEWRAGVPARTWSSEPHPVDLQEARRRLVRFTYGTALRGEPNGVVALVDEGQPSVPLGIYRAPWSTSLTGGAPHVFGDESLCLALVPRNQGFELLRLEHPSLRPLWSVAAYELRDGFDVRAATWDERAVYFVHASELQARAVATGSLLWKCALPAGSGPWKVERLAGRLLVWPQSHAGLPALPGLLDPFTATVTLAFGRRGIGSVPILFVDTQSGGVKDRLDVPHDGGPVFVNVQGTRLMASAGGKVRAWSAVP